MRKLLIILFLLFSGYAEAAPPSRQFTYSTGTVISSSAVTSNEDSLFNYLQSGVDSYSDGTIVNADIHSSANIQSDKLNLTAIAQSVANSGSTTLSGTFAANGTTNSIGNGGSDVLTLNVPGGMTLSAATTWTLTGALTFSGTIADLGTVTTANIDGGTMDGVQVGGTTATGELIVNDASDDADGLGSQGTSGQYLTSQGTGVNPIFTTTAAKLLSATAVASNNSGNITLVANKLYLVVTELIRNEAGNAAIGLRFNDNTGASSYRWVGSIAYMHTTPAATTVGDDADDEISLTADITAATTSPISGNFYIDTTLKGSYGAEVWGKNLIQENSAGKYGINNFAGQYLVNETVTSFEIYSSLAMAGDIYVYEFQLTP